MPPASSAVPLGASIMTILPISDARTTLPTLEGRVGLGRQLRRARKHEVRMRRQIAAAVAEGDDKAARRMRERYLASYHARLLAVADANRRLRPNKRKPVDEFRSIARGLDVRRSSEEEVWVHAVDKPGFDFRAVLSFGPKRRAQQVLCRNVADEIELDPRQHGYRNGGRDAAVQKVLDAVESGGRWFVQLDIEKFYNNVNQRRLHEIVPLPQDVIDNVVLPPDNLVVGRVGNALGPVTLTAVARRGISQGSALSPLVAEAVIASVLRDLPCKVSLISNYADNFGLIGRTKKEVMLAAQALIRAFRRCPHGPFQMTVSNYRRVADGFDFLGYRIRNRSRSTTCLPTKDNKTKFFQRIYRLMTKLMRDRNEDTSRKIQAAVLGWRNAFQHFDDDDLSWTRYWVVNVARYNCPQAEPYVERLMEWADGRFVYNSAGLLDSQPLPQVRSTNLSALNAYADLGS